ncbi:MAG: hypothetical protein HQ582_02915 [Planctomycetes bacterium]|nr:hypothetical protein [Planctomycetota bacterium]
MSLFVAELMLHGWSFCYHRGTNHPIVTSCRAITLAPFGKLLVDLVTVGPPESDLELGMIDDEED